MQKFISKLVVLVVTCYISSNPTKQPHPMVRNPNSMSLKSHGKLFDPAIRNTKGQSLYVMLQLRQNLSHIKVLKDCPPDSPLCWLACYMYWFLHGLNTTNICITSNFQFSLGNHQKTQNHCINLRKIKTWSKHFLPIAPH